MRNLYDIDEKSLHEFETDVAHLMFGYDQSGESKDLILLRDFVLRNRVRLYLLLDKLLKDECTCSTAG